MSADPTGTGGNGDGDDGLKPLQLLQDLASRTLGDLAIEAPRETQRSWRGFAFGVGGSDRNMNGAMNMVFPFMGGFEILPERDIQPIPWAASWVRGITSVRGEIYSVVDFPAYLGLQAVSSIRNATLFILPDTSVRSALLIADRITLRSFTEYLPHGSDDGLPTRLREILSAVLVDDTEPWYVLDPVKLLSSNEFLEIAA